MKKLFWLWVIKIGHFGFKNLYFTLLRYEKNNQRKLSSKSIWMNREFKTLPKTLNILIQLSMRFVAQFRKQNFVNFFRRKITFRISTPECFFDEHHHFHCNQICTTIHMPPVKEKIWACFRRDNKLVYCFRFVWSCDWNDKKIF